MDVINGSRNVQRDITKGVKEALRLVKEAKPRYEQEISRLQVFEEQCKQSVDVNNGCKQQVSSYANVVKKHLFLEKTRNVLIVQPKLSSENPTRTSDATKKILETKIKPSDLQVRVISVRNVQKGVF